MSLFGNHEFPFLYSQLPQQGVLGVVLWKRQERELANLLGQVQVEAVVGARLPHGRGARVLIQQRVGDRERCEAGGGGQTCWTCSNYQHRR